VVRVERSGLSDAQKCEIWRRWKEGWSLSDIGRALGTIPGSIHDVVSANGGVVAVQRQRAAIALTFAEREWISRGLVSEESLGVIASWLGRPPWTISREVTRATAAGRCACGASPDCSTRTPEGTDQGARHRTPRCVP
jgi:IS30 family transposase